MGFFRATCDLSHGSRDRHPRHARRLYSPKSFWCIEILNCVTAPTSRYNAFGATLGGYLDITGTLLPIERQQSPQEVTQDKLVLAIRLADDEQIGHGEDTLASADSQAAARVIDCSCYWLPVYYAARGCTRGLIDFRGLGLLNSGTSLKNMEKM